MYHSGERLLGALADGFKDFEIHIPHVLTGMIDNASYRKAREVRGALNK